MTAVKPRTRTRTRSEEKRCSIMNAAATTFTQQGYDAASMAVIAERAGVSKQTVYSHFGSKKELFVVCIQSRTQETVLNEAVLSPEGGIREELSNLAHRFLALINSPEGVGIMRICTAQADRHPELAEAFYDAGPKKLNLKLKRYLDDKVAAGELTIPNSDHAAWQFLSMLQGESKLCANLGIRKATRNRGLSAYIDSCVDVFLAAYQRN